MRVDLEDGELLVEVRCDDKSQGSVWITRESAVEMARAVLAHYEPEPEPDPGPTFQVGQPVIVTGSSAAMPHSLRVGYPATVVGLPDKDGDLFLRGVSAHNIERIIDQYVNVTDVRHVQPDEYTG